MSINLSTLPLSSSEAREMGSSCLCLGLWTAAKAEKCGVFRCAVIQTFQKVSFPRRETHGMASLTNRTGRGVERSSHPAPPQSGLSHTKPLPGSCTQGLLLPQAMEITLSTQASSGWVSLTVAEGNGISSPYLPCCNLKPWLLFLSIATCWSFVLSILQQPLIPNCYAVSSRCSLSWTIALAPSFLGGHVFQTSGHPWYASPAVSNGSVSFFEAQDFAKHAVRASLGWFENWAVQEGKDKTTTNTNAKWSVEIFNKVWKQCISPETLPSADSAGSQFCTSKASLSNTRRPLLERLG